MNKIKKLLSKVSENVKILLKKFPVTMSLIIFVTMIFSILVVHDFSKDADLIIQKIYTFCMIFAVGCFFTETFFLKRKSKIISYLVTGIISIFFTKCLLSDVIKNSVEISLITRILFTYIALLISTTIYKTVKSEKIKFEEYILKVFRDLFNVTVIYVVLNIGLVLLTVIFVELILNGAYGDSIELVLTLVGGLFYAPAILYSVSNINKNEVTGFVKGLILYVLLPLVTISIFIIYIYIAKIIILRSMPKNVIFRILTAIFIVAFPIWNMGKNFQNNKVSKKISEVLPYLYAPFILLEIYSMIFMRIKNFGITPSRYIACAFIVFQIISLILTFYKKQEKISDIFIYFNIIFIIVVIGPFNYERVSLLSQKNILINIISENTKIENLTENEKEKASGAYKYLITNDKSKKYLPNYLSEEDINKLKDYTTYNYSNMEYMYYTKDLELDITEYNKISQTKAFTKNENDIIIYDEKNIEIDLTNIVNNLKNEKKISDMRAEEYFEENNIINLNKNQDLFVSNFNMSYNEINGDIKYINIEGYILEK